MAYFDEDKFIGVIEMFTSLETYEIPEIVNKTQYYIQKSKQILLL